MHKAVVGPVTTPTALQVTRQPSTPGSRRDTQNIAVVKDAFLAYAHDSVTQCNTVYRMKRPALRRNVSILDFTLYCSRGHEARPRGISCKAVKVASIYI